jgi:hypothetical protein
MVDQAAEEAGPGMDDRRERRPGGAGLPVPPRPLLGRARDVDEARRLLLGGETRLLTLTGPGGAVRPGWRWPSPAA